MGGRGRGGRSLSRKSSLKSGVEPWREEAGHWLSEVISDEAVALVILMRLYVALGIKID